PYTTATNRAHDVGFANYNNTSHLTVTTHIPPSTGTFSETTKYSSGNYVEVIVQWDQPRGFSGIFGSDPIPIKARAVARMKRSPATPGLLLLNPSASGVLSATGNGSITVKNSAIVVNSTSSTAITTSGSNSVITDASPGQPILVA